MRETKAQLVDREPARNPTGVSARVLVIDDEPIIRDVLHDILSREGYVIDSVPDAESGLKALDSGERDLIILDLMLPGIGGFETLKEIKRRDPDSVVVMITAYGSVETAAQAIHLKSGRPEEAFVVVNSGSMPADLLESNLFGHVKGAFTGAIQSKKGLFEVANGGSIFFDEISTIKPEVQAKLLRVIQEKEFLPLGAVQSEQVDVRIIAATNIDLQVLVQRGEFREDLYYRLNVINIKLPPLQDRREDIPLLVDHFIVKYAAENGKVVRAITPEALALLINHSWPGNVRELENVIERAVVLASSPVIGLELLPETLQGDRPRPLPGPIQMDGHMSFYETMDRLEREIILGTLKSVNGVQRKAAARLGLNPTTLNEKIKRLKIQYR